VSVPEARDGGGGGGDAGAEREVRDLVERWAAGTRRGDLAAVLACYSPDVVAFDAIGALRFQGLEAYRTHWQACLAQMPGGEMILEVHDLAVVASGEIAFAHYLSRCGCIDPEGVEQVGWMRGTVCCRRMPEGWRIVHEHYSMPFDPESGKVLEGLAP